MKKSERERLLRDRKIIVVIILVAGVILKRIFSGNMLVFLIVYLMAIGGIVGVIAGMGEGSDE